MNFFLSTGEIVECKSGPEQSGAEGDIYLSLDGKSIVKIYHVAEANRRQSLESIIGRYNAVRDGSFWKEYYCWPDGVIVQPSLLS